MLSFSQWTTTNRHRKKKTTHICFKGQTHSTNIIQDNFLYWQKTEYATKSALFVQFVKKRTNKSEVRIASKSDFRWSFNEFNFHFHLKRERKKKHTPHSFNSVLMGVEIVNFLMKWAFVFSSFFCLILECVKCTLGSRNTLNEKKSRILQRKCTR